MEKKLYYLSNSIDNAIILNFLHNANPRDKKSISYLHDYNSSQNGAK